MSAVMNEREDETTNHPQGKTKFEPRPYEQSNHVTGKFMRRRGPEPKNHKETDSQPVEKTTGTEEK